MSTPTTYLLVHGAWSGAWCWRDVGAELTKREVPWVAVDLPSSINGAPAATYLADDAREVIEIAKLEGPVTLVGHSYGGAVITEAADRVDNLVGLIYVAALVPLLDQSASEAKAEVNIMTKLDEAIKRDGDHLHLNPELTGEALFQDCFDEIKEWAVGNLSSQTVASFRSPRSAFDVDVPSRYVLCSDDRALDPTLQQLMATRCGEMTTLASGHSPFLSRPEDLCDLLLS